MRTGLLLVYMCSSEVLMPFRFKDNSLSSSSESDSDGEDTQYAGSNALKPVVCLGWQPGSDVFVLGETLQFRSTGEIISPDEQQYVFIRLILEKLGMANTIRPINTLPDIPNPLYTVMEGIHKVAGDNHICALFCLGRYWNCSVTKYSNIC